MRMNVHGGYLIPMHMHKPAARFLLGIVVLALCLSGCAQPVSGPGGAKVTHTAAQTPAPALLPTLPTTPAPPPADADIAADARDVYLAALTLDYAAYDIEQEVATITELLALRALYEGMAADYLAAIRTAADAALARAQSFAPQATLELALPAADWRFMVALSADCEEKPEQKLLRLSTADVCFANGVLTITASLPAFETFFEYESRSVQYEALSIYCYLHTVYDEFGEELHADGSYAFPAGYAESLVEPLPKRNIKDGWYNDRSNATRRHMGTDITAPEGRIIHAIGAGAVLYIGYTDLAGNYVVVADNYGFRLTYCHMVEPTTHVKVGDRVEAGQIIGNVGNTGNSDAPHLHLSVITPEYRYVNPYPLLARVRELTKGN